MTVPDQPTSPLEPLPANVLNLGKPLDPHQLDATERINRLSSDLWSNEQFVTQWALQQNSERRLRRLYAVCVLILIAAEIIFASVLFILLGRKVLVVDQWVANIFFGGVFTNTVTIMLIVTRYLFGDNARLQSRPPMWRDQRPTSRH